MELYHLGIDIGGTKTSVGIFDADFRAVKSVTMPTQPQEGCRTLVRRIGDAYRTLLRETGVKAQAIGSAGAASPGPLDLKKGTIVHIPTMGFRNEPLADYLREELGMPVALENDTNAAALCESVFGQGKDAPLVVYITVSTGVGCGIAYQQRIVDGAAFSAGELGHFKVVRGGRACPCGGSGCLEMYASGTADHLGYAIAGVYQLLDPDILVLGGSVTKDYDVLEPLLLAAIRRYTQEVPGRQYRLTVSQYGGEQVLLGAAYYGAQAAQS